jgi:hypothetical protein
MRCYCCNKALTDFEATRKSTTTDEYLDMCNKCYGTVKSDMPSMERADLAHEDDFDDDWDDNDDDYHDDISHYDNDEDNY